jgi:hypothetical protein
MFPSDFVGFFFSLICGLFVVVGAVLLCRCFFPFIILSVVVFFLLSLLGFLLWLETSFAVNFFCVSYEVICVRASFCEYCDSIIFGGIMCS